VYSDLICRDVYSETSLSSNRIVDIGLDSANTVAFCDFESHVTILTPVGAPRVLDEPVLDTVFFTVTNDKDSVVQLCAAWSIIVNASLVAQYGVVCMNCDSYWSLLVQSILQVNWVSRVDLNDWVDLDISCIFLFVLTSSMSIASSQLCNLLFQAFEVVVCAIRETVR